MMISNLQLAFIKNYLSQEGITKIHLQDDLVDHFSCVIEEYLEEGIHFDEAFKKAKGRITPDGAKKIEDDLNYLLTINNQIMIRKIVFLMGYFSVFLIITAFALYLPGILDKETSGLIAMGGIFSFSTFVLPFYFYQLYKKSLHKLQNS
ncbi:hypothetical protein GTQ40_15470 [Flavobacteriaceae bacterium R38]|nr:hypothetical protein [Flavobacteriaceae bacterium R38]